MLTCGIFYCRDSAEINDCGSLQTSSWLDSDMLRNRQQKHTAVRYKQAYRPNNIPDIKTKIIDRNFVNLLTDILSNYEQEKTSWRRNKKRSFDYDGQSNE